MLHPTTYDIYIHFVERQKLGSTEETTNVDLSLSDLRTL